MENISTFLMMYLIAFYHEVRNLPHMAGYYFYAGLAVVMTVVAAVNCPAVQPFLPWPFVIPQDDLCIMWCWRLDLCCLPL